MAAKQKVTRKLRAILSADVKGYSRLMSDDESNTIQTLKAYQNIMTAIIERYSGRVVDTPGDNLLAEFSSIVNAVQSAVEIQKALKHENTDIPIDKKLEFRIGVNIGDVIQDGERLYGDGVNIAARIEGLADPGGVCISRGAYDHVKNKLKMGYEFIGEHNVKNIKDPVRIYKLLMEPADAGKLIGDEPKPLMKPGTWATVIISAIVLILIGYQVFQKLTTPEFEPASINEMAFSLPDKPSIAVLPFENMSGDPSQEYFSDGLTADIITALSKVPKIFVIARNSTFTYKSKSVKVQEIAEDLGVRYILEGSLKKNEDRVRVNAQLIDAITGHYLWAEQYDNNFTDIFDIQDKITKEILLALQINLTHGEQARIYSKGTDSLSSYLKAMQAQWYTYLGTKEGNSKARRLIEEAIELDSEYAYAYRILGITHLVDVFLKTSDSPKKSFQQSIKYCKKAIALDESFASAYATLGYIMAMLRKHDESIRLGKRAIELEPNSADVLHICAAIFTYAGMEDEAIPMFRRALRLNPKPPNPYYRHFGHALRSSGQYEEAIVIQKKAIKQEPDDILAYVILASSASLASYHEEARSAVKEILRIDPEYSCERLIAPFKDANLRKRVADALRKAGLPDHAPAQLPDKPSIAVLPFNNLSGDSEQEYFSDGMTDDIITDLSKISGLMVISSSSTFTYKNKEIKLPVIAKELGVTYVLEGSVRRAGDEVRINAQLIDAVSDHHIWADRFDDKYENIFALQDKITERIVSALAVKLSASEQQIRTKIGTNNITAYDTFLKGMSYLRKFTAEDLVKAAEYFEEAVKLDPRYSEAYANLAYLYMRALYIGQKFWDTSGIDFFTARLLARKNAELSMKNPTSKSYTVMAMLELYKRNFNKAVNYARQAEAMSPNDSDALYELGRILHYTGKQEESIKYHKKSIMLDPLNRSTGGIGVAYFVMGDYEKAVKYIEKNVKDYPQAYALQGHLASAHAFLGNNVKAKKAYEKWRS